MQVVGNATMRAFGVFKAFQSENSFFFIFQQLQKKSKYQVEINRTIDALGKVRDHTFLTDLINMVYEKLLVFHIQELKIEDIP